MRPLLVSLSLIAAYLVSAPIPLWADFNDGVTAYQRNDYDTASQEFRSLAEQGHAEAQFNLGFMYIYGRGGLGGAVRLVGVRGFEPPAPASQRQCSTIKNTAKSIG